MIRYFRTALFAIGIVCFMSSSVFAQQQSETAATESTAQQDSTVVPIADDLKDTLPEFSPSLLKVLGNATALNKQQTAFLDRSRKRVLLKTRVACNDCLLEMLCCQAGTKEHEAVLAYQGKAYVVHTALLALGLQPGKPVVFSPEFQEPSGPVVTMKVHWQAKDGKLHSVDARKWMRTAVAQYYARPLATPPAGIEFPYLELRYDKYNKEILWFGQMSEKDRDTLLKRSSDPQFQQAIKEFYAESQPQPMTAEFVFAGSFMGRRTDESPEFYAAEDGYLVCVANFAAAMIDVKEASSANDASRAYEANPTLVPPRGTPVLLELTPKTGPEKTRTEGN